MLHLAVSVASSPLALLPYCLTQCHGSTASVSVWLTHHATRTIFSSNNEKAAIESHEYPLRPSNKNSSSSNNSHQFLLTRQGTQLPCLLHCLRPHNSPLFEVTLSNRVASKQTLKLGQLEPPPVRASSATTNNFIRQRARGCLSGIIVKPCQRLLLKAQKISRSNSKSEAFSEPIAVEGDKQETKKENVKLP
jgi:hypothetical protein